MSAKSETSPTETSPSQNKPRTAGEDTAFLSFFIPSLFPEVFRFPRATKPIEQQSTQERWGTAKPGLPLCLLVSREFVWPDCPLPTRTLPTPKLRGVPGGQDSSSENGISREKPNADPTGLLQAKRAWT